MADDTNTSQTEDVEEISLPQIYDDGIIEDSEKDLDESNDKQQNIITQFEDEVDEHDLIVLEPEHPLLKRFQAALKSLLEKQLQKVEIKYLESNEAVRKKKDEHMSLGNTVYNLQQELIRNQNDLEKTVDDLTLKRRLRTGLEDNNQEQMTKLSSLKKELDLDIKKVQNLRNNVNELHFRYSYLMGFRDEIKGDIKVLKNAASRSDNYKLEEEAKLRQDFVLNTLVKNLDDTFENCRLYQAQLVSQIADKEAVKQALLAAEKALENVSAERTRLMSEWHTSVYGLQHRNELYVQMMKKLHEREEQLICYDVELQTFKKSINNSQHENEKLTILINRTMNEIQTIKKQCQHSNSKYELLKQEYATKTRLLSETEFVIQKTKEDRDSLKQEVDHIRENIQNEEIEKLKIEKEIENNIKEKLIHCQAKTATLRAIRELSDKNRRIESIKTGFENELINCRLEKAAIKAQIDEVNKKQLEFNEAIKEKNSIMDQLELQISRNVNAIQHKQDNVDRLSKELDRLLRNNQGEELGPFEAMIKSLNKSIALVQDKIDNLQQVWLKDQQKMVEDMYKQEAIRQDVQRLSKQVTILRKKKIRLEAQIQNVIHERKLIESSLFKLQKDLERLNLHIFYQSDNKEKVQVNQKFKEIDFRSELREMEKNYQDMVNKLDNIVTEKDDLLLDLIDSEKIVQHWERKIQLVSEMKDVIACDYVQNELNSMKAEIHRMKVRQVQLAKMQESLLQDLEKSVTKREIIVVKSEALQQITHKFQTKGGIFKQIRNMKEDMKKVVDNLTEAENSYESELAKYNDLSENINSMKQKVDILSQTVDYLKEQEKEALVQKSVNIQSLYSLQHKLQHYRNLKDGNYTRIYKTNEKLDAEFVKQKSITQSLLLCIDQVTKAFQGSHYALKPLYIGLSSRMTIINRYSHEKDNETETESIKSNLS